jgi:hypothetical protein
MKSVEHARVTRRHGRRLGASLAFVGVGLVLTPLAGVASAQPGGTPPGSDVSHESTPCADHGGFGALGTFGPGAHDIGVNFPGSNLRAGATSWMFPNARTGSTTGGNNNSLCGGGNVPPPFAR